LSPALRVRPFDEPRLLDYRRAMSRLVWLGPALLALAACSGSDAAASRAAEQAGTLPPAALSPEAVSPEGQPAADANPAWATFVDPDNGLSTQDVRDADREIVHFDVQSQAMIWGATGDAVSGWVAQGNDLRWDRGGAFRVRFGSEAGEHRAYFTEAGPGTICNLSITAPEQLSISSTNQTPPRS
jgi:hypothetical protein